MAFFERGLNITNNRTSLLIKCSIKVTIEKVRLYLIMRRLFLSSLNRTILYLFLNHFLTSVDF